MIADLLFFMFAGVLLLGAIGVVSAKNPMYSVLFLVLCFFNAAGLFILIGAEFLGLLLMMVYVGAIAVMFLFVLMTVDMSVDVQERKSVLFTYASLAIGAVLLLELLFALVGGIGSTGRVAASIPMDDDVENIVELGRVLFTNYMYPFISVSMVLLVGMVGAIVLTHRRRENVLRQDISEQIHRKREDSIAIVSPTLGKGIS
ncbi:MAG: NADH-quinone oxidoreductase subunit J [Alphaproteobacteria bacterium]|jgi:NADH-quinone oxidoreductase subunit J